MLMMGHPNNPHMRLPANRIYIYEIVQLEPPPHQCFFCDFVSIFKYLGTEGVCLQNKKLIV